MCITPLKPLFTREKHYTYYTYYYYYTYYTNYMIQDYTN